MKTSDSLANDGFCPVCHNELKHDLAGRGFVYHKDSKFCLDRRGGVPLRDENGQLIACTYGYGEKDGAPNLEPEPGINRDALEQSTQTAIAEDAFDPRTLRDARERIAATIVRRRGQPEFRRKLLEAYGSRCAVTGCNCVDVLEAAHVYPYCGPDTNHVCNGLLLRSDLHTLFDLALIGIDPEDYTVVIADSLRQTIYAELAGKRVHLPANSAQWPNRDILKQHRRACVEGWTGAGA
jgi:hypothetical protein